MKFNTRYSDKAHAEPFMFKKDSMTQQEFGYCLDINNIVEGSYNPFVEEPSKVAEGMKVFSPNKIQEGMYQVAESKSLFNELPSKIRDRFDNNPVKLLEFLGNEKNREEAIALGLVNKPVIDTSIPPTPATDASSVTST